MVLLWGSAGCIGVLEEERGGVEEGERVGEIGVMGGMIFDIGVTVVAYGMTCV